MKVTKFKRLFAYSIDLIFLGLILIIINSFIPNNRNINILNQELNNLNESFIKKEIDYETYINRYASINYDMDKNTVLSNIITTSAIIIYFVIVPYYCNGKTLGLYLNKYKIVKDNQEQLTINSLLIRNFIVNGLIYSIVSLIMVFLTNGLSYLLIVSSVGLFQIILVIISLFMISYRSDQKGLQDILSKTQIVSEN